ncbi:MAG: excinuclease ABC subunit UvrA [Bdellovibrionota bacterium]
MIILRGVRQNNLKNISLDIPSRKITVITGLSGSGKSSLAFETLYAEGQRRYIESLSTYTRQFLEKMQKPDADLISNIPPAIALEQRNSVLSSRSTVGTQTEILDYLRILFAKAGRTYCIVCGEPVKHIDTNHILQWASSWLIGRKAHLLAAVKPHTGIKVIRQHGFNRVLMRLGEKTNVAEIDDVTSQELAALFEAKGELFIIVDRFAIKGPMGNDDRARLLDSIDQAMALNNGKITFATSSGSEWKDIGSGFACIKCGREHTPPEPALFSFNSALGACPTCSGFGFTLEIDEARVVPDPSKTLKNGAIDPLSKPSLSKWQHDLFRFAERQGVSVGKRYQDLTATQRKLLWQGSKDDPTFPGILNFFEGLKKWKYKLHIRVFIRRYQTQMLCPDCHGSRLRNESLTTKIAGHSIADTQSLTIGSAIEWISAAERSFDDQERTITRDIMSQLKRRLELLNEIGINYLQLSRFTKTLSGGEFQRINLATHLSGGLCGTLYVLDEPSIGLHAADTGRVINSLKKLRDNGNTVVVVEHDLDVMRSADWLVELGPGAGHKGGEVIAQGTAADLGAIPASVTGKYLSCAFNIERPVSVRPLAKKHLRITGCRENNLKNISVEIPLEKFVVVSGVSGSGKSTLAHQIIYKALSRFFYHTKETPGGYDSFYGAENLSGVALLDQTPIGKSSRSNPATYIKAWDEIRRIYANQALSLRRGYTPQHFSFNVDGGRCPVCKGEGQTTMDMFFMAEVKLPCEECDGKRFKRSILDISHKGKNVHQLLHTTIDEAFDLFRENSILTRKLGVLRRVGLGYLQLGQSVSTLSGGESQRLKIAAMLDERDEGNLLYLFDEPTTGLHLEDIKKFLLVIHELVDAHNSVLMIEHHLDVIAQADWVIDLGPGGGDQGGHITASCPPALLPDMPDSVTGAILKKANYRLAPLPENHRRS